MGSKNRIGSKNSCKPNLMGVTTRVLEILFVFCLPKQPNFPMGSKNRIGSKIHASTCRGGCECMETEFGKHDIPGFGEIATFHIWPNFHFGL